jgi:hypothetical protein
MMRRLNHVFSSVTLIMISVYSSSVNVSTIATLYRSSVLDETARIHVATFDATDSDNYNQENREQARKLSQSQS